MSSRQALLSAVEDYRSSHPAETELVDRFHDFVAAHADCFERSLKIGHVTGSAWLVNRAGSHVLLTHHRKLNMWLQLGGHADGEPNVLAVARREAREESGIAQLVAIDEAIFDLDIHRIPARRDEPQHWHYDVRFACQTVVTDSYAVGNESHDLAWVEIAALGEVTQEPSMLRMARKWLTRPLHQRKSSTSPSSSSSQA